MSYEITVQAVNGGELGRALHADRYESVTQSRGYRLPYWLCALAHLAPARAYVALLDAGSCRQDESSRFQSAKPEIPAIDDELYFVDIGSNASDAEESTSNSILEDDVDVNKYLFQTDKLITLLA
ncbi:unnamed protein product [Heligmosomoides polygyrus]|uniref:Transposase n=1 Tax=Heligmosomoides polygyrus TaxID=6339 RepID=A0A183GK60_HELPZ|nr:unnamed protein product [Heligmosomoides polygyrus]